MTRILVTADNHGILSIPKNNNYDFMVIAGDFLPNSGRYSNRENYKEGAWQYNWIKDNKEELKRYFGNKAVLMIMGNHDFINPVGPLQEIGIEAYDLTDKSQIYKSIYFHGFPWVNYLEGRWNHELEDEEYNKKVKELEDRINFHLFNSDEDRFNILVSHSPIHRILDRAGIDNIGSVDLLNMILYKDTKITHIVHGHCHESNGVSILNSVVVVNCATVEYIIEV
jgi:Icc-related predicted phosphoesterase